MAQTSRETLLEEMPGRRPFVLTRSGNVGTFQHAGSSWSGDNYTSWKTLQGSVAMGLNAGVSLIQSYGTDVGGFAGPLPGPELFTRWVQYGCTNSRFCIHSFKPNKDDLSGTKQNNLPWMVSFLCFRVWVKLGRMGEADDSFVRFVLVTAPGSPPNHPKDHQEAIRTFALPVSRFLSEKQGDSIVRLNILNRAHLATTSPGNPISSPNLQTVGSAMGNSTKTVISTPKNVSTVSTTGWEPENFSSLELSPTGFDPDQSISHKRHQRTRLLISESRLPSLNHTMLELLQKLRYLSRNSQCSLERVA